MEWNKNKYGVEVVCVYIKEEPDEERYEDDKSLISHDSRNYTWIIHSGY
jgi:hypothetical protein